MIELLAYIKNPAIAAALALAVAGFFAGGAITRLQADIDTLKDRTKDMPELAQLVKQHEWMFEHAPK